MTDFRNSKYKVNPLILNRHSPRAMNGEDITKEQLMTIFEAGRFAPSAYNGQPWKFLFSFKKGKDWDLFFEPLIDFNKSWVINGSVLVVITSDQFLFDRKSETNQFDAGASWQNMALQAYDMGLVIHGMSGFDYNKIRSNLDIPESYDVLAMFVVGKPASKDVLPKDLQEKEVISDRKDL